MFAVRCVTLLVTLMALAFVPAANAAPYQKGKFDGLSYPEAWDRYSGGTGEALLHVRATSDDAQIDRVAQLGTTAATQLDDVARRFLLEHPNAPVLIETLLPVTPHRAGSTTEGAPRCTTRGVAVCTGGEVPPGDNCPDNYWCDYLSGSFFHNEGVTYHWIPPRLERHVTVREDISAYRNRSGTQVTWSGLGSRFYGDDADGVGGGHNDWTSRLSPPESNTYYCDGEGGNPWCRHFQYWRTGEGEWTYGEYPIGLGGAVVASKRLTSIFCAQYRQTSPGLVDDTRRYGVRMIAKHWADGPFDYEEFRILEGSCW